MMTSRGPWAPKLRPDQQPKVVADRRGSMLVPTRMLVAAALRRVPRGRLITAAQLRERLAIEHRAELTCPMTTGIFLNIVAGATEEALAQGRARQATHLRSEGHDVSRLGRVADVERALMAH